MESLEVEKVLGLKINDLKKYTLSPDKIREEMCGLTASLNDGFFMLSQKSNKAVFEVLFLTLEERFKSGLFSIIDWTNCSIKGIKEYIELANRYYFNVVLNIFKPEKAKENNAARTENKEQFYKVVPDGVIDAMRINYEEIVTWLITEKADLNGLNCRDLEYLVTYKKDNEWVTDFSNAVKQNQIIYSNEKIAETSYIKKRNCKTFIFGDIHEKKIIHEKIDTIIKENQGARFIFIGDIIDKAKDFSFILTLLKHIQKGVDIICLRWNHERYLADFAFWLEKLDNNASRHRICNADISSRNAKLFWLYLHDFVVVPIADKLFCLSHWGTNNYNLYNKEFLLKYPIKKESYIYWPWEWGDYATAEKQFTKTLQNVNAIQVHWHRWKLEHKCDSNNYNLEVGVNEWIAFSYLEIDDKANVEQKYIHFNP